MSEKPADNEQANPDATAAAKPAPSPKAKPQGGDLTAAEAAKRVGGTVRVVKTKDGKPVYGKGVYATSERKTRAEDVLAFAERNGRVSVVTVDGQRLVEGG